MKIEEISDWGWFMIFASICAIAFSCALIFGDNGDFQKTEQLRIQLQIEQLKLKSDTNLIR